jgi:hypothetical protein
LILVSQLKHCEFLSSGAIIIIIFFQLANFWILFALQRLVAAAAGDRGSDSSSSRSNRAVPDDDDFEGRGGGFEINNKDSFLHDGTKLTNFEHRGGVEVDDRVVCAAACHSGGPRLIPGPGQTYV